MPRGIKVDREGLYHLRGLIAGARSARPLQVKENAEQLLAIIKHFTSLYFCVVAGLQLLGSHYHLSCRFEAFRKLTDEELLALAKLFYPGSYRPYLTWGPAEWERFNRRLFNVSELMRNIQQAFARWFNRRYHRRGPVWAGRFQSTQSDHLVETVYYIELNAVRAGLVGRPEQWRYGSAWMREHGQDGWLMPLVTLLETADPVRAEILYWANLYWRGTRSSKKSDAVIPVEVAEQMHLRQIERAGYLSRHEAFSRGHSIGSRERIAADLEACREKGIYRRRRNPIAVGIGGLYALRAPRKTSDDTHRPVPSGHGKVA
jgi:hypothetical protein